MSTGIRKILRDKFIEEIREGSKMDTATIAEFVDQYVEGNDTISGLLKTTAVKTKATVISWRKKMQTLEAKYEGQTLPEGYVKIPAEEEPAPPPPKSGDQEAELDPVSREFQLVALGAALKEAHKAKQSDKVVRISAQIAKIQGFEAKSMGRQYDETQVLGEEGLKKVDDAVAVRVAAFAEWPDKYPKTCAAIIEAAAALTEAGNPSSRSEPKQPDAMNFALDTPPRYARTAQIAHDAPQVARPPFLDPSSTPPEVEKYLNEHDDEADTGSFLDDVTEELK